MNDFAIINLSNIIIDQIRTMRDYYSLDHFIEELFFYKTTTNMKLESD